MWCVCVFACVCLCVKHIYEQCVFVKRPWERESTLQLLGAHSCTYTPRSTSRAVHKCTRQYSNLAHTCTSSTRSPSPRPTVCCGASAHYPLWRLLDFGPAINPSSRPRLLSTQHHKLNLIHHHSLHALLTPVHGQHRQPAETRALARRIWYCHPMSTTSLPPEKAQLEQYQHAAGLHSHPALLSLIVA